MGAKKTVKRPDISTDKIVEMYLSGLTATQIALSFDVQKSSIRRRLLKRGVLLRKNSDYKGEQRTWTWKGEQTDLERKRFSRQHQAWSRAVRQRDNFTCRDCGKSQVRLHAHHLVDLKECLNDVLAFDVNNGITLCVPCHGKRHAGQRNGKLTP